MKNLIAALGLACCMLGAGATSSLAQDKEPARARVAIYHVAPGKHVEFLKWLAAREEVAKEAGVPAGHVYAHTDGDSWDYLAVDPVTTPEQDKKVDELAKKKGLKIGFAASIEFRALVASHTDTFVIGPTTAAQLVSEASK
jgi:hypothetical protein